MYIALKIYTVGVRINCVALYCSLTNEISPFRTYYSIDLDNNYMKRYLFDNLLFFLLKSIQYNLDIH